MTDIVDGVPAVFRELFDYERVMRSPTLAGEVYSGPPATLEARTAIAGLTGLVHAASRAQDNAQLALSWRDYRVGASGYMCNFNTGRFGYFDGYNVKPERGQSGLNLHAEQITIAKGRAYGLNKLIGIAIYADPQNADANPENTPTLRPCGRCVDMFAQAPEVDDNTLVLGTNPDMSQCELYTVGYLNNAADTEVPSLVDTPFSLQTEEDLINYDRVIKPQLIGRIYSLFD